MRDIRRHPASRREPRSAPRSPPPDGGRGRSARWTAAVDWGDLAGGAGYFDQAHFGHEFRAFTGLTPTRYVEVRRRFLREHPGHVLDGWPLPAD
jgi:AraC-like DNA-binding protein